MHPSGRSGFLGVGAAETKPAVRSKAPLLPPFALVPTTRASLPEPMYATLGHELPRGSGWTFEPKYDGMRVIADASARQVRLTTRNGKEKSSQFPEVVLGLRELARRAGRGLMLDGEIVANRRRGRGALVAGDFQQLQARMHLRDPEEILRLALAAPVSLIVFDLLRDGRTTLTARPWSERRARLDALFAEAGDLAGASVRLSETSGRGASMLTRARRAGWEGIIAKRTDAPYRPGARSEQWLKLKLLFRAEFVVGGFTEPRKTRPYFGALLLGAFDERGDFVYVGHTGGGFTRDGLAAMYARLARLERRTSPFVTPPRTNERAHWVAPKVVVEVKFAEWTSDRLLRQPIYLGTRDDKAAREVTIEGVSLQRWGTGELKHDAA
jgi:bifunctional non-homologous end joining protein LigD